MEAWRQFMEVARPYWHGDKKRVAWSLLTLLVVLMLAETQLAVMLNNQAGEMTSALAGREADRFWTAVRGALLVLAFAVPVYAFYYYMRDNFANHWRRWLTGRFLDGYLGNRKYYEIGSISDIDNPDQRISEDIDTFTGRSTNFLLIFVGSLMQLIAFSAVLWSISHVLVGFLALYAFVGTFGALYFFGAPLIRLNFWQLRREADFRFGLMRLRENAESIAFYRGEPQERQAIDQRFDAVYNNYARLIRKQRSLNLFQRAFSQLTLVVPSIILANDVLSGELEVGRAVQAAGAFVAVLGAVSLIVDNFEALSRFVAGIARLHTLAKVVMPNGVVAGAPVAGGSLPAAPPVVPAMPVVPMGPMGPAGTPDAPVVPGAPGRAGITGTTGAAPAAMVVPTEIRREPGPHLNVDSVTLYTPQFGRMLVEDLTFALQPGDGLLIAGASGCGKSSLLRVIAGLWRTGSGTVRSLPAEEVFFLPQKPYMQVGSLRSQILYPSHHIDIDDLALLKLLREVHLEDLAERVGGLHAVQDWEKLLSMGEQQRLAFARVLIHKPRIAILDEATSALDNTNEASLYARLRATGATVVSIAHRAAVLKHHTHVLKLDGQGGWELIDAAQYRFEQ
ncbi:ATP-binding cassette domain-containing protein [Xylophilus sp. Kf1]|nr:ATP-binding cassette domain-containing protein [Xylophilus sp. Kf1]